MREKRVALGLGTQDLTRLAKVGGGVITRLEDGETQHVRPDTVRKLAKVLGVTVGWLLGEDLRPSVESPTPPPVSDTYVSDERLDGIFDQAIVPGVHLQADVRVSRESVLAHNTLLRDSGNPVEYVRKLLDTAARCRAKGRKVTPGELYEMALGVVVDELAAANRQIAEQQALLNELLAAGKEWAERHGVEPRDTPHPALVAGIEAAQRKTERHS